MATSRKHRTDHNDLQRTSNITGTTQLRSGWEFTQFGISQHILGYAGISDISGYSRKILGKISQDPWVPGIFRYIPGYHESPEMSGDILGILGSWKIIPSITRIFFSGLLGTLIVHFMKLAAQK